jgi:hypothetical protein
MNRLLCALALSLSAPSWASSPNCKFSFSSAIAPNATGGYCVSYGSTAPWNAGKTVCVVNGVKNGQYFEINFKDYTASGAVPVNGTNGNLAYALKAARLYVPGKPLKCGLLNY